jgi:hypothetical protein
MAKTKLGPRGKTHVSEQMERFERGKLLRTSSGKKLNPEKPEDRQQALAIFYSEAERGEERGFEKRTYKGSRRTRPKKA